MAMNKICLSFILSISVLFSLATSASAKPRIVIAPEKVGQGDVFCIKVTKVKTARAPSASFEDDELYFGSCGAGCYVAIGAVEMKSKPGTHLVKLRVGKNRKNLRLYVKKVDFPKVMLTLPEDKVILSPEDLERAKRENERMEKIFLTMSEKLWDGGFVKPLENELSTAFGAERVMNGKLVSIHKGIDINGKEGAIVKASNNGRVALAEGLFFGGNTVILDHGQGIYTIYMHLSKIDVNPGDIISKGDVIGLVGATGRATGPHLHFGTKVMNVSVNPMSLVGLRL